jgi:CRISPR-associated protein Cas2
MTDDGRTPCLICYDISESQSRLVRVRRVLIDRALPIQLSVFLGRFTRAQRRELLKDLGTTIDPRRDDVRLYPLPDRPNIELLGRPLLTDGVFADLCGFPRRSDQD